MGLLALLFIGLKLGDVIDWSWWWVLAPIWIPFGVVLVFVVFCFGMALLAAWIKCLPSPPKPRLTRRPKSGKWRVAVSTPPKWILK